MNYPGSKLKTYHHIINLIPPHEIYIEPFVGSGTVIRKKRPSNFTVAIDKDKSILKKLDIKYENTKTLNCNALDFLRNYKFTGNEVVYCDPPYLHETRRRKKIYKHEMTDADHEILLKLLLSINTKVLISGYKSELYTNYLQSWNYKTYKSKTHTDIRNEYVWFNYDQPNELHDYRYLGSNFRERQDIKRKLDRIKNRITSLSMLEKSEIISWINSSI